jgi:crotonobetainyl-CoA:carnitine CoA-transferase CaiB-like acyl-CoA transferase
MTTGFGCTMLMGFALLSLWKMGREWHFNFPIPVIATHTAEEAYHAAQAHDLAWGAIRRPEDNLTDAQFGARGNIVEIEHEGLGKLPYTTAPGSPTRSLAGVSPGATPGGA